MAAPKENQFWKIRSKHGRDKLFSSSSLLWDAACEYFEWCDEHPFFKTEAKVTSNGGEDGGSSVELVEIPVKRPYTMGGLCLYIGCDENYFRNFKHQETGKLEDFKQVIDQIKKTIYDHKFCGAASGFFNANIIARDLGLVDKKEVDAHVQVDKISGMEITG